MVKVIAIPKTPKSAYQPSRKASDLIKAHLSNLEFMAGKMAGPTRAIRSTKPRSEGQAALRIAELTQMMHPTTDPVPAAIVPAARAPRPIARKKPPVKRASAKKRTAPKRSAGAKRRAGSKKRAGARK